MSNAATCTRVNIDKMVIDGRYQRALETKRVATIVENFDPKLLGTLELSARSNGTFAVIDGQHRFEALKLVGRKQAPALVHKGLSVQQEADLFARTNMGRKQLHPIQRFRAQVFSGDPQAVEIQDVITRCGFKVEWGESSATLGNIGSIVSLERIYRAHGVEHLERTLLTIADLWFGERAATDQHVLRGVALFLHQYGDRFDEQHVERLRRVPAITVMRRAKERSLSVSNEAVVTLLADELRKITGLRGTTGRKDVVLVSKKKSDELATA